MILFLGLSCFFSLAIHTVSALVAYQPPPPPPSNSLGRSIAPRDMAGTRVSECHPRHSVRGCDDGGDDGDGGDDVMEPREREAG